MFGKEKEKKKRVERKKERKQGMCVICCLDLTIFQPNIVYELCTSIYFDSVFFDLCPHQ